MPRPRGLLLLPYVVALERITGSYPERIPEPMVMDEPQGVVAFHEAGRIGGSNLPLYEVWARAISALVPEGGSLLDLGCGSARFLARLARRRPDIAIRGLDLSNEMLATGERLLAEEGLADRVTLGRADITSIAGELPDRLDLITSIFALHHLPSGSELDGCLRGIASARDERRCAVFLADFARLRNARSFRRLLQATSGMPPALKPDAIASERAAWAPAELTAALDRAGLGDLGHSLARPLPVLQVHWAPGAADRGDGRLWRDLELPRRVRVQTAALRHIFGALPDGALPRASWPRGDRIQSQIAELDPIADTDRIMLLSASRLLPRRASPLVLNLLYCLGFTRVCGQREGARAVDREGTGKVHRHPDRRAEETISHFALWIQNGPGSEQGRAALERVRGLHDRYSGRYPFSNQTAVHTIALFTVQFDLVLRLVGAPALGAVERKAAVAHWRTIGEALGVRDMPETWQDMESFVRSYESSPEWFGPTPEGRRSAEALIRQFASRWFPRGTRWIGRWLLLSLLEDHVPGVVGQRKPPWPVVRLIRSLLGAALRLRGRLLGDPRRSVDLPALAGAVGAVPRR